MLFDEGTFTCEGLVYYVSSVFLLYIHIGLITSNFE